MIGHLKAIVVNTLTQSLFTKFNLKNFCRILKKYKEKYLIIAPPPQSPKYLINTNNEITDLFLFSKEIQKRVDKTIDELFKFVYYVLLKIFKLIIKL